MLEEFAALVNLLVLHYTSVSVSCDINKEEQLIHDLLVLQQQLSLSKLTRL